jgi:hypothetical protein
MFIRATSADVDRIREFIGTRKAEDFDQDFGWTGVSRILIDVVDDHGEMRAAITEWENRSVFWQIFWFAAPLTGIAAAWIFGLRICLGGS